MFFMLSGFQCFPGFPYIPIYMPLGRRNVFKFTGKYAFELDRNHREVEPKDFVRAAEHFLDIDKRVQQVEEKIL